MDADTDVTVSRLTVATAADFLREYHTDLTEAGADGPYTDSIESTLETLDAVLETDQTDDFTH